jgi:prepilin-type processing-associated H-X9-DG protein
MFEFEWGIWRVGNVAEYAIAKSGSWHGGAGQCNCSFVDGAPMGPHSRAFHDTSDAASREVIFATAD